MSISVESFLVLEESLSKRVQSSVNKAITPLTKKIVKAIAEGDYEGAAHLIVGIDVTKAVESQHKYFITIGKAAVLFGASRLSNAKFSGVKENPPMVEIEAGARLAMAAMAESINRELTKRYNALNQEEQKAANALQDTSVQKAEKRKLKELVSFGRQTGRGAIHGGAQMVSSLHTSRLGAWGYLMEAEALGVTNYEISEQLDNRICPVCRRMHGKTFSIPQAKSRLSTIFASENPADIKDLAPWPSQSKAGLREFDRLSDADLAARGWSMPPFHPLCRGILVKTGAAPAIEGVFTGSNTPELPVQKPLKIPFKDTADFGRAQQMLDAGSTLSEVSLELGVSIDQLREAFPNA